MTFEPIVTFEVDDSLNAVVTCPTTGSDSVHPFSVADIFKQEINARLIPCLDGQFKLYEEDKQELLELLDQLEGQILDMKTLLHECQFTISKTTPLNPG